MNEKPNSGFDQEALKNQMAQMTTEELVEFAAKQANKAHDQEQARIKYQAEAKTLKDLVDGNGENPAKESPKEEPKSEDEGTADVTPVGISPDEVRLVQQGFSDSEIEMAKKFAAAFGVSLVEASQTDGFKAQLAKTREEKKSADMSLEDLSGLNTFTSDDEFMKAVSEGRVDLSDQTHAARFKKIKVKQMTH